MSKRERESLRLFVWGAPESRRDQSASICWAQVAGLEVQLALEMSDLHQV